MARDEDEEFEVGYGKPPKHSQFKKGVSGNPHGRPAKRDKEPLTGKIDPITDVILRELGRQVELKEGLQTIRLSTVEAIIRSLNVGAIKGDRFQQKTALELGQLAQESRREIIKAQIETVLAYKERWEPRFEQALDDGRAEPKQLPHPAHVEIDPTSCRLRLTGPDTAELKNLWEWQKYSMRTILGMVIKADAVLVCRSKDKVSLKLLAQSEAALRKLEKDVPPGWNWREELGWEEAWEQRFSERLSRGVSPLSYVSD